MKTAFNTLRETHQSILVAGFNDKFLDFSRQLFDFHATRIYDVYEIVVLGEQKNDLSGELKSNFVICPVNLQIKADISCSFVITCGMDTLSSLSFTSIGEENAMLSVNRKIDRHDTSIEPCERPVEFFSSLSVYENLALSALALLYE